MIGGPYHGDTFTGTTDMDDPQEFSLVAGTIEHLYRKNEAGEWYYHGLRSTGSFVSVEAIPDDAPH